MRLAVVGSRSLEGNKIVEAWLYGLLDALASHAGFNAELVIVSGECPDGPDKWAETWARERGIKFAGWPADWKALGLSAGYARNGQIAQDCEVLVALWDGFSRGTHDTMQKAHALGRVVMVLDGQGLRDGTGKLRRWSGK